MTPNPKRPTTYNIGDIVKWISKEAPDYECWPHLDYITKGDCFMIVGIVPGTKGWNFYEVLDMSRNQRLTLDSDMLEVTTWAKRVSKI